jgi:hypothetical protein
VNPSEDRATRKVRPPERIWTTRAPVREADEWRRPPFERGLRHDKQSAPPDLDIIATHLHHRCAASFRRARTPLADGVS